MGTCVALALGPVGNPAKWMKSCGKSSRWGNGVKPLAEET